MPRRNLFLQSSELGFTLTSLSDQSHVKPFAISVICSVFFVRVVQLRRDPWALRCDDIRVGRRRALFLTFNNKQVHRRHNAHRAAADATDGLIEFVRWANRPAGLLRTLPRLYDGSTSTSARFRRAVRHVEFRPAAVDIMMTEKL